MHRPGLTANGIPETGTFGAWLDPSPVGDARGKGAPHADGVSPDPLA